MTEASDRSAGDLDIDSALINQVEIRQATAGVDELYEAIARQLGPDQRNAVAEAAGIKLPSPAQIGKAFHDKLMPRVTDGICHKAHYCKNRSTYEAASQLTALAVKYTADAITAALGVPVPFVGDAEWILIEAAALVLKQGLNDLCGCPD
jgi:hypothetical protein